MAFVGNSWLFWGRLATLGRVFVLLASATMLVSGVDVSAQGRKLLALGMEFVFD